MNLKNYTSEVPAITSMGRIERCLVEAGATDISKKYLEGVCRAIRFRMPINNTPIFFELPARVDSCFKVLWEDVKRPRPDTRKKSASVVKSIQQKDLPKVMNQFVDAGQIRSLRPAKPASSGSR